jgi:O-antigen/teichoic acid export membrane protein
MTLKKNLGNSTLWMSFAATGSSLVSFGIFIILSRLLQPEDIGLVAFALVVVEMGKILVNAGFAQAVVQHPFFDQRYASTCFFSNLFFAFVVTLLVIFIGAPLVSHYYQPTAGKILSVLSLIFFLEGAKAVHEGKLKREFAFHVIAMRTLSAGLLSGALGVFLAIQGYGVWALVWQQLTNHFVTSLLSIVYGKWKPSMVFSWSDFKQLMNFSSPLMLAQLINNISGSVFEFLVGIILGPASLGFYRVGGRALYILQDIVLKPFEHTALSALSRLDNRSEQAQGALRMLRMSAYLTLPIFFGAAAMAPDFIVGVFGEKWHASGSIMTILAIALAPLVIGYHTNAALTASGHSRYVMLQACSALTLSLLLGATSIPFGLMTTAYAFALRNYLVTALQLVLFKKIFNTSWTSMLNTFLPSGLASLIMFAMVFGANHWSVFAMPALIKFIALCCLGCLIYLVLMTTLFRSETRNFFKESLDLAPTKFKPVINRLQGITRLT